MRTPNVRSQVVQRKPCIRTSGVTSQANVCTTGTVTAMTMAKSPILKFERGSISFRHTLNGTLEAWDVLGSKPKRDSREYKIMRSGLMFWEAEEKLLTGWEPDFPGYEAVDWGDISPVEAVAQNPDEEYQVYQEAKEAELVELYSDLAEEWEEKQAEAALEAEQLSLI